MRGNIGCPCPSCNGKGKLHGRLKAILEAFELDLGCEVVVTSGYRCATYNAQIGGVSRSRHQGDPGIKAASRSVAREAFAVDFWPDDVEASKPKWRKWYRKRHTFEARVRPWFHYCYINQSPEDNYRKWSVHGQLC